MADDPRITNQENYLVGRTLRWRAWSEYRRGWDHDHCEFCMADITDGDHGFVTEDDYHWVCPDCFRDFQERFEWKVDRAASDAGVDTVL